MDLKIPILLFLAIILMAPQAFASAVVEQRQQMMQRQQQEAIRQKQQQIIQQQQQAYQQAAIQQKQKAQQQLYQRAVQERAAAQQAQQAYNQAVEEKLKGQAQRQVAAQNPQQQVADTMRSQQMAYQQQMQQLGVLMSQQPSVPNVQAPAYGNLFYEPPVEEVVDIAQVWEKMEENSQAWGLMIDMQPKVMTVQRMIDRFKEKNIQISKDPGHYVELIDTMAFQSPDMLDQPFENILKIVAVIEYDFNNGQDKDALARQIFPDEKGFQANRKRLGL